MLGGGATGLLLLLRLRSVRSVHALKAKMATKPSIDNVLCALFIFFD